MAEWVPHPGAGPVLELEALVTLVYAEHGTKQDILATLDRVRSWSDDRHDDSVGIARAYLDGEGAFPERQPWLELCGQFLEEFDIMVEPAAGIRIFTTDSQRVTSLTRTVVRWPSS